MGYKRKDVEQTKQYAKVCALQRRSREVQPWADKVSGTRKEAKAVYKIDGIALVNCEILKSFGVIPRILKWVMLHGFYIKGLYAL